MDRIPYGFRRARRTTQCWTEERTRAARSDTRADSLRRRKRLGRHRGETRKLAYRLLACGGGFVLRAAGDGGDLAEPEDAARRRHVSMGQARVQRVCRVHGGVESVAVHHRVHVDTWCDALDEPVVRLLGALD